MATTKYDIQLNLITKGLEQLNQITKDVQGIKLPETFNTELNQFGYKFQNTIDRIKKELEQGIVNQTGLDKAEKSLARMTENIAKYTEKPISEAVQKMTKELDKLNAKRDSLMAKYSASISTSEALKGMDVKAEFGLNKQAAVTPESMNKTLLSIEKKINAARTAEDKKLHEDKKKNFLAYIQAYKANQAAILESELKAKTILEQADGVQKEIDAISKEIKELPSDLDPTTVEFKELLETVRELRSELNKAESTESDTNRKKNISDTAKNLKELNDVEKKHEKTLSQKIISTFSYYTVFNKLRQLYREMIRTITDLDIAMTDITVVTTMNRQEAWGLLNTYQSLAKEVGLTTSEVARLSTEFFKQGRNLKDSLELTRVAAKSALVASIDVNDAADYLTSAVNGFGLAADAAVDVADKLALLSAASATDFEEIAIALSKVSPVAKSAGIDLDWMIGILSMGLETTREAPENIGTAFKTIFARMRELTDLGAAAEDGMSLNRVDKALQSIGVPLRAAEGGFRNLDEVLTDVGRKWKDLDNYTQAYLATVIAGTRQQPRLLAVFNDFERTEELIQRSKESANALEYQHMSYMQGMQAATTNLATAWEGVITAVVDSEMIIRVIQGLGSAVDALAKGVSFFTNGFMGFLTQVFAGVAVMKLLNAVILKQVSEKTRLAIIDKQALISKKFDIVETYKSIAANKVKNQTVGTNIALQRANAITTATNTASTLKETIATVASTAASYAKATALKVLKVAFKTLLGPVGLVIAALQIIPNLIKGIISWFKKLNPTLEDFNTAIKENNKQMYDNINDSKDLEKVVKRYKEIQQQVHKTKEELDELALLNDQLLNYSEEKKFAFTLNGRVVFDEKAYQQEMDRIEKENQKLFEENVKKMNQAIQKKGINAAMSQQYIRETFYQQATNAVIGLADGIEDAATKTGIQDQIASSIALLNPENFLTQKVDIYKSNWGPIHFMKQAEEQITGSADEIRAQIDSMSSTLRSGDMKFDEKLYNDIAEKQTKILIQLGLEQDEFDKKQSESRLKNISMTAEDLERRYQLFKSAEAEIKTLSDSESIENNLLEVLYDADSYGKAIDELRKKGLGNQLILSLMENDITNLNVIDKTIDRIVEKMIGAYDESMSDKRKDVSKLIENVLIAPIDEIPNAMEDLRNSTAFGEWKDVTNEILSIVGVTAEATAEKIGKLSDTAVDLTELNEKLAKNDFSTYDKLLDTFSDEELRKYISGQLRLDQILESRNKKEIENARRQVAYLEAIKASGIELSTQQDRELAKNKIIVENERLVNESLFYRNALYKEISSTISRINELVSNTNRLVELGMDPNSSFIAFLDKITNFQRASVLEDLNNQWDSFGEQYKEIIQEMVNNDLWKDNSIDIFGKELTESQKRLVEQYQEMNDELMKNSDKYLSYIEDMANKIAKEYDKQKKAVEDRYKTESDLIKEAFDARWNEIEYTNKLAELQTKIANARKGLIGASIDNSSELAVRNARNSLRDLQLERQKLIEQEMLNKAQEKLEEQKEKELQKLSEKQIEANKELIAKFDDWSNKLADSTDKMTKSIDENTKALKTPKPADSVVRNGGGGGGGRGLALASLMEV